MSDRGWVAGMFDHSCVAPVRRGFRNGDGVLKGVRGAGVTRDTFFPVHALSSIISDFSGNEVFATLQCRLRSACRERTLQRRSFPRDFTGYHGRIYRVHSVGPSLQVFLCSSSEQYRESRTIGQNTKGKSIREHASSRNRQLTIGSPVY